MKKGILLEFGPRFRLDLVDLIEHNRRKSRALLRISPLEADLLRKVKTGKGFVLKLVLLLLVSSSCERALSGLGSANFGARFRSALVELIE